ncbi:MAG: ABC transporter permease [Bryobacteraceae bacterium]|nr:ABC transporter permease [Bryobacteraceae bacterium]
MLAVRDNLALALDSIRAHRLRSALTILGLTMGVTTLITVMTIVQGANVFVEQKIANLGTNVFQISRLPFTITDFNTYFRALRHKYIELADMTAVARQCHSCALVGGSVTTSMSARYRNREIPDIRIIGHTASMAGIDTRTVENGRYFNATEDQRGAQVCLIGHRLVEDLFAGMDPLGQTLRIGNAEFQVIGSFEPIGSILGQDQDSLAVVPMGAFRRIVTIRRSVTIEVKAAGGGAAFDRAVDEARFILRSRRRLGPGAAEDFFVATASSYIALWQSISAAFFAVFIMVSAISAVVGGIVIMNVMLVSVTERTKEIGIRRAAGATQRDILRQFLTESVLQCLAGGFVGISLGFAAAVALDTFTQFPASVQTWVAVLGVVLSTSIGLFFGIYPAMRAARLDPVAAIRSE